MLHTTHTERGLNHIFVVIFYVECKTEFSKRKRRTADVKFATVVSKGGDARMQWGAGVG